MKWLAVLVLLSCAGTSDRPKPAASTDPSPHASRMVAGLEILDWGGKGMPIVFLAGNGNTAHIFDDFAPRFVDVGHVIGITRRGFGASSATERYDVPALGGDVLRILDELHIDRAVIIGHSIAGEEMTWLASQHPDRIRALVYVDAAYDRIALREALDAPPRDGSMPPVPASARASVAAFTSWMSQGMGMPLPVGEVLAQFEFAADGTFVRMIDRGEVSKAIAAAVIHPTYDRVTAPVLALFAVPADPTTKLAVFNTAERARFRAALPAAQVVELAMRHYLFVTDPEPVAREIRAFLVTR